MDTISAKPMPTNKKEAQALQSEIDRITGVYHEKVAVKASNDSIALATKAAFAPVEADYLTLEENVAKAKSGFSVIFAIMFIVLVVKIFVFAFMNYKNSLNIRGTADWAKKASNPLWAFIGWIIPVYNFVKPYSFFNELSEDTTYLLKDKGIISDDFDKEDNSSFIIGMWWGLFLVALVLGVMFIQGTFFSTGALFLKLGHASVAITVTILWALYLLEESYMILKFNQLNKTLADNESKL